MSAGPHVRAGLVAYSQGAPEVIVRMDVSAARDLLHTLEAADASRNVMLTGADVVMDRLRTLFQKEHPRGG